MYYSNPYNYNNNNNQWQQNPDEKIWVQGEAAAEAYLIAPNGFVRLWDANGCRFYEKKTDSSGRPIMDTYEYQKVEKPICDTKVGKYTNEDIIEQIKALRVRIERLEGVKDEQ